MLKSLYSGVTGMKGMQTKMDVISNNIANVNTTGFKAGRVRFADMISQVNANAQGPTANGLGGSNAQQVGLGVQVSATDTMMGGGSLQSTGRALDFAIQNGDNSFFTVSDGTTTQYTRDGGFYADAEGNLVTPSGHRLMGFAPTAPVVNAEGSDLTWADPAVTTDLQSMAVRNTIPNPDGGEDLELQSFNVDNNGWVTGTYSDGESYVLGRVALTSFSNPDGLEKTGGNMYVATANSGQAITGAAGEPGYGIMRSGFLEMSNVDLATEFTEMIVTSRAYQANSRSITVSDTMLEELINLKR